MQADINQQRENRARSKREWRARTNNAATKKYERTINGKLMRIYRNMQSRITGVQKQKSHLYQGKYLLGREQFYEWARANPDFLRLYNDWVKSGYERKLAPTVDRINPSIGYQLDNMQWLTHSENSRRGGQWSPKKAGTLKADIEKDYG